jgi:hypothetical protein
MELILISFNFGLQRLVAKIKESKDINHQVK